LLQRHFGRVKSAWIGVRTIICISVLVNCFSCGSRDPFEDLAQADRVQRAE
jgi:hypothetical protein